MYRVLPQSTNFESAGIWIGTYEVVCRRDWVESIRVVAESCFDDRRTGRKSEGPYSTLKMERKSAKRKESFTISSSLCDSLLNQSHWVEIKLDDPGMTR